MGNNVGAGAIASRAAPVQQVVEEDNTDMEARLAALRM